MKTKTLAMYVEVVQRWILEGHTPKTKPAMEGLVKEVTLVCTTEVPGQRFHPHQYETKVLVPDHDGIAERVNKQAPAIANERRSRVDYLEVA